MAISDTSIEILNENMVERSHVVAFMGVKDSGGETVYARMKGFTELTTNKNAKEYNRQYVDEAFERTTVVGFNSSISYAFDDYKGNVVLTALKNIADMEISGGDATIEIVVVDMNSISLSSGSNYTADAIRRQFSVVPSTSGDTTDCMTYSGDFKACGEIERVTVTGSSINPSKWLQCKVASTVVATVSD